MTEATEHSTQRKFLLLILLFTSLCNPWHDFSIVCNWFVNWLNHTTNYQICAHFFFSFSENYLAFLTPVFCIESVVFLVNWIQPMQDFGDGKCNRSDISKCKNHILHRKLGQFLQLNMTEDRMQESTFITELLSKKDLEEKERTDGEYLESVSFSQILQIRQTSLLLQIYLMISELQDNCLALDHSKWVAP